MLEGEGFVLAQISALNEKISVGATAASDPAHDPLFSAIG
jgi:hypothetical protein